MNPINQQDFAQCPNFVPMQVAMEVMRTEFREFRQETRTAIAEIKSIIEKISTEQKILYEASYKKDDELANLIEKNENKNKMTRNIVFYLVIPAVLFILGLKAGALDFFSFLG